MSIHSFERDPPLNARRARRSRIPGAALWAALVLAASIGIGGWLVVKRLELYSRVARTLPSELAGARREGLPLTPNELRAHPPIPDSQNAAPLYQRIRALLALQPKPERYAVAAFLNPGRTAADRNGIRKILMLRAPLLGLAEQAGRLPYCDFHRQYELGPDLTIPEYSSMRELARLLGARALLQSDEGRPLDALKTAALMERVAVHAGEEPILIAMLVGIAVQSIMDTVVQQIVLVHMENPAVVRRVTEMERALGPLPSLEHSFRYEVVMCMLMVESVRRTPSALSRLPGNPSSPLFVRPMSVDAWQARSLSYWRRTFSALRAHRGDLLGTYVALKRISDAEDMYDGQPTYELSAILEPMFSSAELKIIRVEAERRLRQALLAVVTYRQNTGRFPAALSDLPATPAADPFTGRPLLYRRTAAGFVLYSVGENFKDDGGNAKPARAGGTPPDIVIQYPLQ